MSEKLGDSDSYQLRKEFGLESGFKDAHDIAGFISRVYQLTEPDKETDIGETTIKIIEFNQKFISVKFVRKSKDDFSMELRVDNKDGKSFGNLAFIKEGRITRFIKGISQEQLDFVLQVIQNLENQKEGLVSEELAEVLAG